MAIACALFGVGAAHARPAPIRIVDAVCPAPPNGARTAEAGFTIVNDGPPDRLLAASSPAAGEVELHSMSMTGGVMRMAPIVGGLPAPHGRTVVDAASGRHLMFIGLKGPLKLGARASILLRFQHAGVVRTACTVEARE